MYHAAMEMACPSDPQNYIFPPASPMATRDTGQQRQATQTTGQRILIVRLVINQPF